jgi:hypothetical protein
VRVLASAGIRCGLPARRFHVTPLRPPAPMRSSRHDCCGWSRWLFVDRASAVQPSFRLTENNAGGGGDCGGSTNSARHRARRGAHAALPETIADAWDRFC